MSVRVYQYPKCGTCRKALKWLDAHGVAYTSIDIVATPPTKAALRAMWKKSGLPIRKLFNTSGASYREGGFGTRLETLSDDDALSALAADGKLIKRPLVDGGDFCLVGFKETDYAAAFGR